MHSQVAKMAARSDPTVSMTTRRSSIKVSSGGTSEGEKRSEHEESRGTYRVAERSFGAFCRVIPLPVGVAADRCTAEFTRGVLRVRLPKTAEPRARGRRIEVKSG